MAAFNLTAELNLRGPSNLNQIVGDIRRQLSSVSFNLNINPSSARGVQQITASVNTLSTALRNAQTNAAALSTALRGLGANVNVVVGNMNTLNTGLNNTINQINQVGNNTRNAGSEMAEFGRQSALAIRRFAAFSVATGAVYALVRAVSSAYDEFITFNKEFVKLQQVTNSSAAGLSGLANEITRLSTNLGVSSAELLTVSSTLAQAGLSATQTKTALEALAKSALAPSFDNLNDTVEGSIALMRQFGLSAGDLEGALGSINAVAARFAVESGDIITAIQRTGGVFAAASKGVSEGKDALNEFIAVFTSVRATTRESAETIATGLRTIFTRVQRGGTIEALKEFGISLTDIEGKFVGPYEAIRRLSEGLKGLDPRDLRFSKIVEELGGFRQIGKVIPLIQQFATAQQALGVAQRGSGSLASDAAKAQEALAVRVTKVREEFIALIRDIGQSKSFQTFADIALKLASALISVASAAKDVLPALAALSTIRAIPALAQFASGFAGGIGRRPRGFAKGGLVPGSGNRDTVPAMLTPGEFVVRKKAVDSIGTNKLHSINKYANGGKVQYFQRGQDVRDITTGIAAERRDIAFSGLTTSKNLGLIKSLGQKVASIPDNDDVYGGAFLSPEGGVSDLKGSLEPGLIKNIVTGTKAFQLLSKAGGVGADPAIAAQIKGELGRIESLAAQKGDFTLLAESLSKSKSEQIEDTIISRVYDAVESGANELSQATKIQAGGAQTAVKVLRQSNIDNIIGNVYEAILNNAGSPYNESGDRDNANDPFDFPGGLGAVSSNFSGGRLGKIRTDAKTRFTAGNISSFLTKAKNYESKKLIDQVEAILDNPGVVSAFTNRGANPKADVRDLVQKKQGVKKALGGFIPQFSSGGSAEDTVPAMLTPGEFVINKKAAGTLGKSKLQQLNNADKLKGFNKGGAVGNIQSFGNGGGVQRFFIGGLVRSFEGLTRIVSNLATRMTLLGRNMPSGGGWNPTAPGATRLSSMGVPDRRGATMRGFATDPMTLMFGATVAGSAIGDAVGGTTGKAIGGGVSGAATFGGIAQAFAPLLAMIPVVGPALAVIVPIASALAGGFSGILQALDEAAIKDFETQLEQSSKKLETSFEKLAKETDATKIGNLRNDILREIQNAVGAGQGLSKKRIDVATPKFLGSSTLGRTFGGEIDVKSLSQDLADAGRVGGENAQKYIVDALSRGENFDEVMQNFGDSLKGVQESIAIAQAGTELTAIKALAEEARQSGEAKKLTEDGPAMTARQLDAEYAKRVKEINEEFKQAAIEQQRAKENVQAVTVAVDLFATAIKNLESTIGRAASQFAEAERLMAISVGSAFGDELKIQGPSRANENVFENPMAYSVDEISSAVQNLGKNLRFDPKFTQEIEKAVLSTKTLESGLPTILATAAAKQETPGSGQFAETDQKMIEDQIEQLFKDIPGMAADDAAQAASQLMEEISAKLASGEKVSYGDLASNSALISKMLEGYTSTVEIASNAQKAYNDMLTSVTNSMNQYVSALERATELQIQAASIRTQGDVQLRQTMGETLDLNTLNQAFEDSIRTLSSTVGPGGVRQAGTLDPNEIDRRLRAAEAEQKQLQENGPPVGANEAQLAAYNKQLADATLKARNLSKAQEKLANDTTRASNALSKIQELRQAQEGRRNTFDEIIQNIQNPEWMMGFVGSVQSLAKVQSGQGTVEDLPKALEALNRRVQGMSVGDAKAEREKFYGNVSDILKQQGVDPAMIDEIMKSIGVGGPTDAMQAAIEQYNSAIEAQAQATENMANRTTDASVTFYDQIVAAAEAFVQRIGQAGVIPQADGAQANARGGLIYASKGRLVNFEPKGTDTVPAMLTPGEFVINKKATQRNLPLLKAINSGSKAYSKGGITYAADGGEIGRDALMIMTGGFDKLKFPEIDGKSPTEDGFERAVYEIENGFKTLKLRSKQSPNNMDDGIVSEFGDSVNSLIQSRGRDVSAMSPSAYRKFRAPYQNAYNKLKERLTNKKSDKPVYIVDDMSSTNIKPSEIIKPSDNRDPGQILDEAKNAKQEADVAGPVVAAQGVQPSVAPEYYDELTYKEYIKKLLAAGLAPQPPDKSKFITPAFYLKNKKQQPENISEELQQQIDQIKQKYEQEYINEYNALLKSPGGEQRLQDPQFQYLQSLADYAAYMDPSLKDKTALMTALKQSTKPPTRARITAFDTRDTSGRIGGGPMTPEDALDKEKIAFIASGLKAETDNAMREMNAYLQNKDNPANKELANKSLEIMGASYRAAATHLMDLSKEANLTKYGSSVFKTAQDTGLNIRSTVGQLRKVQEIYAQNLGTGELPTPLALNDEILNSFQDSYAPIVEQKELPAQLPSKPIKGKDIVANLDPDEKKSVWGRTGVETQYKSAYLFYRNRLGEYNVNKQREAKKNAYLTDKQNRRSAFMQGRRFQFGGPVYAAKGQLINMAPQGTDTVPAMLTPGEFVINKQATQRNLPLLKAINNHRIKPKGFNRGGFVNPRYYADGDVAANTGGTGGGVSLSIDTAQLESAFGTFGGYVNTLSGAMENFSTSSSAFISGLGNLENLANTATAISAAAAILSGSTGGLNSSISSFNSTITQLRSAIEAMPDSIDLRVTGSIPVSVNVTVNDGTGLQDNLQQFANTIYNEVSTAISNATSGALKVNFNTTRK